MSYRFNLPVMMIKEGDTFVAYTPALDLSTSGRTLKEAQDNFVEAVNIFFDEIKEMDTVDEVLANLGWEKIKNEFTPPMVVGNHTESFSIPLSC